MKPLPDRDGARQGLYSFLVGAHKMLWLANRLDTSPRKCAARPSGAPWQKMRAGCRAKAQPAGNSGEKTDDGPAHARGRGAATRDCKGGAAARRRHSSCIGRGSWQRWPMWEPARPFAFEKKARQRRAKGRPERRSEPATGRERLRASKRRGRPGRRNRSGGPRTSAASARTRAAGCRPESGEAARSAPPRQGRSTRRAAEGEGRDRGAAAPPARGQEKAAIAARPRRAKHGEGRPRPSRAARRPSARER